MGEAGIGKSRMIEALQQELAGEAHARINLQCSPYHSDSALYPMIQYLTRAAGFAAADPADVRTEKLRALLAARQVAGPSALPLLAELLSIPLAESAPIALPPAQRKATMLALIVDLLMRSERRRSDVGPARRRPLDRRDHPRNDGAADRQHQPRAVACRGLGAAGFHAALACQAARHADYAGSPRPRRMHAGGRERRRRARPFGGHDRRDRRQDRRRAALRRGTDPKRDGIGRRGVRGAGDAEGFADGPPRPIGRARARWPRSPP